MEKTILKLLGRQSLSKKSLLEKLELTDNELTCFLEDLQKKQLIYLNASNKYSAVQSGQIIGRINTDSKGKKFIRVGKEKIFINPEYLHTALKNDLVVCDIYENNLGNVLGILERKNNRLVCEVVNRNGKLAITPFNVGCEVSLSLENKKLLKDFVEGDRLIVPLENKIDNTNTILVRSTTRIGHKNDPKSDELAIAISKDFDIDFSVEAIKESLDIPDYVREEDKVGRTDLTEETIFTIDSIHTKDMDDAISIKKLYNGNYLLGVHDNLWGIIGITVSPRRHYN